MRAAPTVGLTALIGAGWIVPAPVAAQPEARRAIVAARTGNPPVIDGRIDEREWAPAASVGDFVQQQPDENAPATQLTELRVLFDDRHLYLAVVCFDAEPSRIVVTQSRRDGDLTDSDSVQIVLDTFDDDQNAFLFGTNPLGIEYDGQVAAEGRTGGAVGSGGVGFGGGGSQRGQVGGFNRNWDGDWRVRAQVTERGWEAEFAIPLRTLRYRGGVGRTWGINVLRNLRRRNEQTFLAPIPRAYDIYRVSLAADLTGLELPARRDLRIVPYALAGATADFTRAADRTDALRDVGLDVKWGLTPNLTADFTVNTDFAQVEADEEQINLTRFDLFFPEKRGFFLENAATFQFGQPQQIDLFFSRRIGLSRSGEPIDILGGGRLSGKLGAYNVGLLAMQTSRARDARTGRLISPANNFTVLRLQRELRRSNVGAIFVNRAATSDAPAAQRENRAYGVDANLSVSDNGRLFAFLARSDTPASVGSDYAGRALYEFRSDLWQLRAGFTQVGERFQADVGFVPRSGYRKPEFRAEFTPEPKRLPWIRRFAPHVLIERFYGFDGLLQSAFGHYDFEVQFANGGQSGFRLDRYSDRPIEPFVVFDGRDGRRVVIPPGLYTWNQWLGNFESDPSDPLFIIAELSAGSFYDGHFNRISFDSGVRTGARFVTTLGYIRNNIDLPHGDFSTDLVRLKSNYSFSTRALLQALVQYNSQAGQLSSNIRLAWLDRSGTGLFLVFNERRDTWAPGTEPLGRSFVVKYTRLVDF
jgi:hypothetical protein